ncbi:SBBP repeat-containing protein [Sulfurovum sp. CS9]|uniref:SBBP repeat-containing protein n=1 Tax=Sulfurovum sp. CS9 TaxID=3391146 RepID=UPI0039E76FE4
MIRVTLNNIMKPVWLFAIWFALTTNAHGVTCGPNEAPDQGTGICKPATAVPNPGTYLPTCTEGYRLTQGSNICSPGTEVGAPGIWLPGCPTGFRLIQGTEQCTDMPNISPVANAGSDKTVIEGNTVTLDGSKSTDPDGTIIAYEWKEGSSVLSRAVKFNKSNFSVGTHTITLTVTDNDDATDTDNVIVTVTVTDAPNTPPVANAGPNQTVLPQETVTLDGSKSSDADDDMLSYQWNFVSKPAGSNASLSSETDMRPTFVADIVGSYQLRLIVNDGSVSSAADWVVVTAVNHGTLDPTFGEDGIVVHNSAAGGDGDDEGNDIAVDSSGNTYVTGSSVNAAGTTNMVIWKYKSDGTLDTTFGGDGIVVHLYTDFGSSGNAIALDSAGNIYVTGSFVRPEGDTTNTDMMIWKYKSNGILDTSFSGNGIVIDNGAAGGDGTDVGKDIAVDSTGNVYVTGYSHNADSATEMIIWKYKSDGTLNASFGNNGIVAYYNPDAETDYPFPFYYGDAIALDDAGNIYVTGDGTASEVSAVWAMMIWKYKNDGTPDTTFSDDGIAEFIGVPGMGNFYSGNDIALDSTGNIYIAGWQRPYFSTYMALWKCKSDGVLDSTFGDDGVVLSSMYSLYPGLEPEYYSVGNDIALDSAGNVYVTGDGYAGLEGQGHPMLIWKYRRSNGTLVDTFDIDGIAVSDGALACEYLNGETGRAIVLDNTGNIYVSGSAYCYNPWDSSSSDKDMVIWKYK